MSPFVNDPTPGMPATILMWSDRHAGTVIAYDAERKLVTIQQDTATRTDNNGLSETQEYVYERNPQGSCWFFKNRNGFWREVHRSEKDRWKLVDGGARLSIGHRSEYYDPCF